MSDLLVLENITGGYPNHQVLLNLNLTVKQGDALAIVGENGAGKTTLLKAIVGLVRVDTGDKRFDGESILTLSPDEIARKGIAYVPQIQNVFAELSITEHFKLLGLNQAQTEVALAHFPDLLAKKRQRAQQLSGGQRQQLAIAFALAKKPKLLILDEPTANIQPSIIETLIDVLQSNHASQSLTLLFTEQNLHVVKKLAHSIVKMQNGRVLPHF